MISGIYLLKFGDLVYVGQSIDINRRFTTHCNRLIKNTHSNHKMREAYCIYGLPKLEVLIECPPHELDINEKEAIDIYDSINKGLNICPAAGDFPVLHGQANGNSKHSDKEILSILEYLCNNLEQPLKVSAKLLGIHYSTIKNISNGTGYKWLSIKAPEQYSKLLAYKGKRAINTSINKGIIYKICSPSGDVYNVDNISTFAKQHDLNSGALGEVLRGNTRQHKGWTKVK